MCGTYGIFMKLAPWIVAGMMMSVASVFADKAESTGKHLFILTGQSNMAGLNPKESFIPAVTKEFGAENVIVIKYARGGQPIHRWDKQWKTPDGPPPSSVEIFMMPS